MNMYACVRACVCGGVSVCMYTFTHVYVCACVHVHVCMRFILPYTPVKGQIMPSCVKYDRTVNFSHSMS